jgi:asparagine synthase (glutamine-hydrolysing)
MCGICGIVIPGTAAGPGARLIVTAAGACTDRSAAAPGSAAAGSETVSGFGSGGMAAGPAVAGMIDALMHRGPDESGIHEAAGAVLGATRLAIRGLAGGHQPIVDAATGVTIVCNGEIDNSDEVRAWLKSRGRRVDLPTDIAVLAGLYLENGERFVEDLIGAFAIALWDPREGTLLLARDRAGERPLFFCTERGAVRFATEIAALATDPGLRLTPDRVSLAWYLRFGSFLAPRTPFAEIRKVAPGEVVIFRGGKPEPRLECRRYWRWRISPTSPGYGEGAAARNGEAKPLGRPGIASGFHRAERVDPCDAFDRVFRESVRRQSEAEVDYGVFLSGGVDSSLVAAVARSLRPYRPLTAYTLRFDEPSFDEGEAAANVATLLGCAQVPVWIRAEDLPDGIATLVRLVGEPLADPAWVPTALLARRAAQDVKLCLVGEGADELFGGYPTYLGATAASVFASWPRPLKAVVRWLVESWPPSDRKVTLSFLLKRFVAGAEMDGIARHYLWTSNIPPALLVRLGLNAAEVPQGPVPEEWMPAERHHAPRGPGPGEVRAGKDGRTPPPALLDLVQRVDLETFLAEGLLTKADRAGMQSALELRAPFLDRDVLEFAATLPRRERVQGVTTKVFLKRYALRYLPRETVYRKKRGLSVPLSRWLHGPLRAWAEERLGDPCLELAGVHPPAALDLLREHGARTHDHARALWTLLVLVEWLRWAGARTPPGHAERRPELGGA